MSTAKVVEIIAEGATIEAAIEAGVADVSKSVHAIRGVWVENIQAMIQDEKVSGYRVNLKVTFIVDG